MAQVETGEISTRARILDAALKLFSRYGFAGTSVRQLARAVGLRESSLYNHFPGKKAILEALIAEHGPASSLQRLETARYRALAEDPAGFCRQYADDLLRLWGDPHEQLFMSLLMAEQAHMPELRDLFAEQLFAREQQRVIEYFRGFERKGLVRVPDVREAARLFQAGMTFIRIEFYFLQRSPVPHAKIVTAVRRFLKSYLVLIGAERAGRAKRK